MKSLKRAKGVIVCLLVAQMNLGSSVSATCYKEVSKPCRVGVTGECTDICGTSEHNCHNKSIYKEIWDRPWCDTVASGGNCTSPCINLPYLQECFQRYDCGSDLNPCPGSGGPYQCSEAGVEDIWWAYGAHCNGYSSC